MNIDDKRGLLVFVCGFVMKIISSVEAPLQLILKEALPSLTPGLKVVLKSDLLNTPQRRYASLAATRTSTNEITVDFSGFKDQSDGFMDNLGLLSVVYEGGSLASYMFICDNGKEDANRVKIVFDRNEDVFVNKLAGC